MSASTCDRCGGRLRVYAGGQARQCVRCGRAEWDPVAVDAAVGLVIERIGRDRVRVTDPWTTGEPHLVQRDGSGALACDCADHRYRRRACKHITAAREARRRQRARADRRGAA